MPLDYAAAYSIVGRPKSWIVLGIFSLLIGLLSVLSNLGSGIIWYTIGSVSVPPRPLTINLNPAAPMAMAGGRYVAPHGTPIDRRAAIIAKFNFQGLDADDRNAMLERLLAERGNDIFPVSAPVSISPATTNPSSESPAWGHGIELVVPGGTVSVAMADATFNEASGWTSVYENTVRYASAKSLSEWPRHYNAIAIEHAIAAVSQLNPRMTDAQRSTFADLFAKVSISHSNSTTASLLPGPSGMNSAGVLQIEIDRVPYYISPDGRWIEVSSAPTGIDPSTGRTAPVPQPFVPRVAGSPWLMFSHAVFFWLNILVGILLIIGGVQLFVNSPVGAIIHFRWVVLKLFMMGTEVLLAVLFFCSVLLLPAIGGRYNFLVGIGELAKTLCFQSMYPIIVLITLRREATQKYLWSRNVHLTLLEQEKWSRARSFLMQSRLAWVPVAIGAAVIVAAAFQVIATVSCYSRSEITMSFLHAIVAMMALGFGSIAIRSRRRLLSKSAIACLLAISAVVSFSSPARAEGPQTAPATQPSPEQEALIKRIADDLNGETSYEIRQKDLKEIAALGEAPVKPILEFFAAGKVNGDFAWTICDIWKIEHVIDSPAVQQLICEYVLKIYANNHLAGKQFLDALPNNPKLLDFWTKLVFDPDPNLSLWAAERIPAIDPTGESVAPRIIKMIREAKDLKQQQSAFRLLKAMGIAGQSQFLELFHDRDITLRALAVTWVDLVKGITPVYEGLVATIIDPTQGLDGTPEQLADAKPKMRKSAIRSLWYHIDDPDHRHVLAQLTDPRIIAAHLGNDILSAGTRNNQDDWILALKQPDTATVDDWAAVQRVAIFTFHALGRSKKSSLTELLDAKDPLDRHLALIVMAELGQVPRDATLMIKADVKTEADKAALAKIMKPLPGRSPTAQLEDMYMQALTQTSNKEELSALTGKLCEMGIKGKRTMANPRYLLPEVQMNAIYDALSDSSAFAKELKTTVLGGRTYSPKELVSIKLVLNAALDEEGNFGRGAMRVLQSRDPNAQRWMAQSLLDPRFNQLIGPATRTKCQTILHVPVAIPRPIAMTTVVPEAEKELTWSDFAWRFLYIVGLLAFAGVASCYTYAFYASQP